MEYLGITGTQHGGKSLLMDNLQNNGLNYNIEDKEYPFNTTSNAPGVMFDSKLDVAGKLFEKKSKNNFYTLLPSVPPSIDGVLRLIFVVRDVRVSWLLNGHFGLMDKEFETKEFIAELKRYWNFYVKYIKDNSNSLSIVFEEYQTRFKGLHTEVLEFININETTFTRCSIPANFYLSHVDCRENYNLLKYFDEDKFINEQFKIITNELYPYIEEFGYEKDFTLEEMFYNIDITVFEKHRTLARLV
jgi:hypothetical protein